MEAVTGLYGLRLSRAGKRPGKRKGTEPGLEAMGRSGRTDLRDAAGTGGGGVSADEHESSPPDHVAQRRPGGRSAGLFSDPTKDPAALPDYSKDWKRVAEIVDRLFFWLFLLAITLSTLVLLHPLMNLMGHSDRRTNARLPVLE